MKHIKLFEEFVNESKVNESSPIEIDGKTWGTMQQNANDPDVNIIRLEIYPKSIWITYKEKGKFYRDNFYKSDKKEKSSIPTKESKEPLWLTFRGSNYECSSIKKDIYDEKGLIK
jgi:hypothetical protein